MLDCLNMFQFGAGTKLDAITSVYKAEERLKSMRARLPGELNNLDESEG